MGRFLIQFHENPISIWRVNVTRELRNWYILACWYLISLQVAYVETIAIKKRSKSDGSCKVPYYEIIKIDDED